ncbi:uncharacterized protein udd [Drosophila virilis]|uniref:Uncharacterized protein n=1 Tax=Drosophila virilis TaxID=7244 RepID=B4LQZ6_DROVI|nr:uncharacterized protein LOC6629078 [Drosophila virilis]EDW64535.2 uncharacterized protein Dvir_GJ17156 [Drosophila virilis]
MKTSRVGKLYEDKVEKKFSSLRFPPKAIPKHVLTRTLKIVNDSNDEFWLNKNSSCAAPVTYEQSNAKKHSDAYKKLNLARKCMLTRDWQNLAKLLTSNLVGDSIIQKSSYPIFSEYVSIFLTMEDPELLKKLQQTISPTGSQPNNKNTKP